WKLSPIDLASYSRWYDYSRARDEMFAVTDTSYAPWHVVPSDHKHRARLNLIAHLLKQVPWRKLPHDKVKLPKREKPHGYRPPRRLAKPIVRPYGGRRTQRLRGWRRRSSV